MKSGTTDVIAIILAGLLLAAPIIAGLYVAFVVCLYGGIVDIVGAIQQVPIPPGAVAWGVIKIILTSVAGFGTFLVGFFLSLVITRIGK